MKAALECGLACHSPERPVTVWLLLGRSLQGGNSPEGCLMAGPWARPRPAEGSSLLRARAPQGRAGTSGPSN